MMISVNNKELYLDTVNSLKAGILNKLERRVAIVEINKYRKLVQEAQTMQHRKVA